MSAVKPMRLSFKHIQGIPEGDASTAGSTSPFKKRLNDIFSAGGSGKCFAFEDIILNTQPNSPEKSGNQRGNTSPLRGPLRFGDDPTQLPASFEADGQLEGPSLRLNPVEQPS
jgi:hypothetical protein